MFVKPAYPTRLRACLRAPEDIVMNAPYIHPAIIEEERRREEDKNRHPVQIPLYDEVYEDRRTPPPGWNDRGEREEPNDGDDDDNRTISIC